jgi:hypothetical protein
MSITGRSLWGMTCFVSGSAHEHCGTVNVALAGRSVRKV